LFFFNANRYLLFANRSLTQNQPSVPFSKVLEFLVEWKALLAMLSSFSEIPENAERFPLHQNYRTFFKTGANGT